MLEEFRAVREISIDRESITRVHHLIRPYIRRTPVVAVDGADFGLDAIPVTLKLELLQHTGSFKPRGAFANLLTHEIPSAGVVAASGGNHGAAVAFAARKLGKPARIFVPRVASQAKKERIRAYGADLVVTGERYADALAASREWAAQSGALAVHAYDQVETSARPGNCRTGIRGPVRQPRYAARRRGWRRLIGGVLAAWYSGRIKVVGVEPEAAPTLARALEAGKAGGYRSGRDCRRLVRWGTRRSTHVSDSSILGGQRPPGLRPGHSSGAGGALECAASCGRARGAQRPFRRFSRAGTNREPGSA